MSVEAVPGISAAIGTLSSTPTSPTQPEHTRTFADWLKTEIAGLDTELQGADQDLRNFAVGDSRNIHHVMLSLEKAGLSFQLAVQVRNKLLEAYQEIMRMQV